LELKVLTQVSEKIDLTLTVKVLMTAN